jgi:predicted Fe-S protein YdhL (DUF1289 family)
MITPCIKLCAIDPGTRLCAGCGRTLAEIGMWASYSDEERRSIMRVLPGRLAAASVPVRDKP